MKKTFLILLLLVCSSASQLQAVGYISGLDNAKVFKLKFSKLLSTHQLQPDNETALAVQLKVNNHIELVDLCEFQRQAASRFHLC